MELNMAATDPNQGDPTNRVQSERNGKKQLRYSFLIFGDNLFDGENTASGSINFVLSELSKKFETNLVPIGQFLFRNGLITAVFALMFTMFYFAQWHVADVVCSSEREKDVWFYAWLVVIFQVLSSFYMIRRGEKFNRVQYWMTKPLIADLCRRLEDEANRERALKPIDEQNKEVRDVSGCLITGYGKYCHKCQHEAPMRSHHCPFCDICVLRKDHHCWVTGRCVGLGNQRYFIAFLCWMVIGLTYFFPYFFLYFHYAVNPWLPYGWLLNVVPVAFLRFLTFYESPFNLILIVAITLVYFGFTGAVVYLPLQMFYMSQGSTMYEFHSRRFRANYDGDGVSLSERIRLVMGRNWLLTILFPLFYRAEPELTPQIAENIFRNRIPPKVDKQAEVVSEA